MPDSSAHFAFPNLPTPLSSFGAVVLGDCVYLYGGHAGQAHSYSRETTLGKFRRLNWSQPTEWEELPTGPKLQGLALVTQGGVVYRIGGMQPQNAKSEKTDTRSDAAFAQFNPATSIWTELTPLPEPRSSHDAVVVGEWLFVFGGWRLNGLAGKADWHDHGWKLDLGNPAEGWQRVEQPFRRRALTMAANEGRVYVVGGMNEMGKVERVVNVFDVSSNTWNEGPPLPGEAAHGFTPAAATIGERIYVALADGHVHQLAGEGWHIVGTMKERRFSARMVPIGNDRLLVLGGASSNGLLATCEEIIVGQP